MPILTLRTNWKIFNFGANACEVSEIVIQLAKQFKSQPIELTGRGKHFNIIPNHRITDGDYLPTKEILFSFS